MRISKETLYEIKPQLEIQTPKPQTFDLPEKILQFGTGVLLRGLPDYFIDQANKKGIFNGRIVMIKSTNVGSIDAFKQQDSIYTLLCQGIKKR